MDKVQKLHGLKCGAPLAEGYKIALNLYPLYLFTVTFMYPCSLDISNSCWHHETI